MNNLKNTYSETIDFQYIIDIADGNENFLVKLLKTISKGLTKYPLILNQNLQTKDWNKLQTTAHKFKSSVAYLEIAAFDNLLDDIEKFELKGISKNKIVELVEKVQQLAVEVQIQVDHKIEELTSGKLNEL